MKELEGALVGLAAFAVAKLGVEYAWARITRWRRGRS